MPIASVLTGPLEVVALMTGFLGLRSALVGFVSLVRGEPSRTIADDMAVAIAAGFPTTILVGVAGAIILVLTR